MRALKAAAATMSVNCLGIFWHYRNAALARTLPVSSSINNLLSCGKAMQLLLPY
jgi:hypothetical protein